MSIYNKINQIRKEFHELEIVKGAKHYSGWTYLSLPDFLPKALEIVGNNDVCPIISFPEGKAVMRVIDTEDDKEFTIESPFGSAELKNCHEVQNIGACHTYHRRYLWVALLEIVTEDEIDGEGEPKEGAPSDPYADEKEWYNNFDKDESQMLDMIQSGKKTPETLLKDLMAKYKLSKKTQKQVLELKA